MNRKFQTAILYLMVAVALLALPTYSSTYKGVTGKLLVATPGVSAPFSQSVVFVGQHNLFSAWGVILNRPLAWKTGKKKMPAYFGGPVDCPAHVVGQKDDDDSLQMEVNNGKAPAPLKGRRVVLGCAGWGLLQLNFEIARGSWDVIDYDPALVFDTPADRMWDAAHDRALQDRAARQKKCSSPSFRKSESFESLTSFVPAMFSCKTLTLLYFLACTADSPVFPLKYEETDRTALSGPPQLNGHHRFLPVLLL